MKYLAYILAFALAGSLFAGGPARKYAFGRDDDTIGYANRHDDGLPGTDDSRTGAAPATSGGTSHTLNGVNQAGVNYDGVDAFIAVPNNNNYKARANWTVSLWVFLDDATPEFNIIEKNIGAASAQWYIRVNAGDKMDWAVAFEGTKTNLYISDTSTTLASLGIVTNEWNHLALVIDSSDETARFYVNGVEGMIDTTAPDSTRAVETDQMQYGGNSNPGFMDGRIDEVRIYQRSLSALEVRQLFNTEAE